ncbi:SMC-Scp complex subunit ScpB [Micromonospora sp. NPDC047730]|uniref:SMC-Scp complex subunit ScpB n=1 Tax=Micromonospora sp. NPDC047730 TaxID=3364253 RepID=UPI00371513A1
MSSEERRDSLADQAAAWIPPWQRPTPPAESPSGDPGNDLPPEVPDPSDVPAAPVGGTGETLGDAAGEGTEQGETAERGAERTAAAEQGAEQGETAVQGAERPDPAAQGAGQAETAARDAAAGVPTKQPAGRRRSAPAPAPAPELDDAELRGALEAILLVVDEPVSELTLAQVLEQPAERIGPMLDEIAAGYTAAGHGFELRRAAGGWRLYTRPEYATYVERFVLDGQSVRLTQAALETLAVVAYKQPVTRSRISAIRGVNCDGVIRTLVSRGLVEECGAEPDSGAFLYRTTTMFLEKLGLNSVDDLPPLAPFLPDDVEELADATR